MWTSAGEHCLPGITRANVLRLCRANGIPARELRFSLSRVYGADECFVTGTFAGVGPVGEVDGRQIGDGARGPITRRLQELYVELFRAESTPLPAA